MKPKFIFLVTLTPPSYMNPLRAVLQKNCINSLKQIKGDNYLALLIGEENKVDKKLHYIASPQGNKGIKLAFAIEYLVQQKIQYTHLCRFDDDDIINPNILNQLYESNADCFADKYHGFYDLTSNRILLAKKNWMANTVFMKKEHALHIMPNNRTLIEQDHAESWQSYFESKKIYYVSKNSPIYLRVLSPTSITALLDTATDYVAYLNTFGDWSRTNRHGQFSHICNSINWDIKTQFIDMIRPVVSKNWLQRLLKI